MMGYALFILLFGQENLYYMALLDLGNAFVAFPFLLTKLRMRTGTAASSRGAEYRIANTADGVRFTIRFS